MLMSAGPLGRVVEDDPDGVPHAGSDTAYTVSEVHAVFALRALHWPMMDCEGHSITLQKRYDLGAALHTRTLLGQYKLSASKIMPGLGEQNRDLNRKHMLAIQILMQAVIVPFSILK